MSCCKLFLLNFLFAVTAISSSTSLFLGKGRSVAITDPKLKKLLSCLASSGVDARRIHVRNSGNAYTELNFQWNTLNGYAEPLVYLVATAVSDIQKAVICSKSSGVRIVARSGGHSYVKNGFGDSKSLIVDLASFNQISVDPTQMTCEVRPGARNGKISHALWEKGLIVSQGICPTVGIAGLAFGGGFGHFSRSLGLTSDNIVEIEMVDAKGKLLTVNEATNKDLFWALRGGGGGNFGIVSKFKLKTYVAPQTIAYGVYEYSFKHFDWFFDAWQTFITYGVTGMPKNVFCFLDMEKDSIKLTVYAVNANFNTKFEGQKLEIVSLENIKRILKKFHFPPTVKSSTKLLSYTEFILAEAQAYSDTALTHHSQMANMTKHFHVGWKKVKSIYVGKILKKDQISKLQKLLCTYLQSACLSIEVFGGAVNDLSPSQTAFVHRSKNLYHIQMKPFDSNERPNANADSAMKKFFEESKKNFNHRESYQNYLDQDLPDYLQRYYGANLKKLMKVKRSVDPENMFHHRQSIPVDDI